MNKILLSAASVLAGIMLAGACVPAPLPTPAPQSPSTPPDAGATAGELSGVLSGTVLYRARIALPPQAVIEVQLQDVSRADAAAVVLAEQSQEAGGRQVPIPFELRYDPAQIVPANRYALRARITIDGELRWTNTSNVPVLTGGAPATDVTIMVEPVGGAGAGGQPGPTVTAAAGASSSIAGVTWLLQSYGTPGSETSVLENTEITVMFEEAEGRVAGRAGCNQYTGSYEVDEDRLSVSALAATLMACPEAIMEQESAYLAALQAAESFRVGEGSLQISYDGGQGVLNFVAQ